MYDKLALFLQSARHCSPCPGSFMGSKHRKTMAGGRTTDMTTRGRGKPGGTGRPGRIFAPMALRSKRDAKLATAIGTERHYRTSTNVLAGLRMMTDASSATREPTMNTATDPGSSKATGATTGTAIGMTNNRTVRHMADTCRVVRTSGPSAQRSRPIPKRRTENGDRRRLVTSTEAPTRLRKIMESWFAAGSATRRKRKERRETA